MQRLCGDAPLAAARSLRNDPAQQKLALDCYELGAGSDPAAHYEAASLAYQLGDQARVMRALRASVRLAPFFGDGHFEVANALMSEGHTAEAVASYRTALETENLSDRPMALNNLGNALLDAGDSESALREYRKGLKLAPTFVYLHNGLANVYSAQERHADAVAALEQAISHRPGAGYLQYNYGSALRRLKRFDDADAAFTSAVQSAPNDWRYLQVLDLT
jgi:tetratricopeptide (TPR) repeat protein